MSQLKDINNAVSSGRWVSDEYQMLFVLIMIVYIVLNVSCQTICFGIFINKVMSIIFGPKIEEVTAEHGKLRND